jgi:hypothetical protein
MKLEQTECSETSAYKIQTPANHPDKNIQQIHINLLVCDLFAATLIWAPDKKLLLRQFSKSLMLFGLQFTAA